MVSEDHCSPRTDVLAEEMLQGCTNGRNAKAAVQRSTERSKSGQGRSRLTERAESGHSLRNALRSATGGFAVVRCACHQWQHLAVRDHFIGVRADVLKNDREARSRPHRHCEWRRVPLRGSFHCQTDQRGRFPDRKAVYLLSSNGPETRRFRRPCRSPH